METKVLGTFHGDAEFPIEWREGEQELFWVLDDLHCPNPLSPMFFDIGGWWLTCDHMFRRFGTPFASDWIAKEINGYLYTAAIPADASLRAEAAEYNARYVPRVPDDGAYAGRIGGYLGSVLPHYATSFMDWWRDRLRPEIERNFAYLDGFDMEGADLIALAVLLEEAIDIHDRHWKIHWMINFSQFSATMALNGAIGELGDVDAALPGRLQSSVEDRNWDSIEALWQMKEEIKGDADLRSAFAADNAAGVLAALASERARQPLPGGAARSLPLGVRAQGGLVARVRLPDLVRAARADRRGPARLPRDRLRLSRDAGRRARRPRRSRGRAAGGGAGPRGRARASSRRSICRSGSTRSRPTITSSSTRGRTPGCGSCSSRSAASSPPRGRSTTPRT